MGSGDHQAYGLIGTSCYQRRGGSHAGIAPGTQGITSLDGRVSESIYGYRNCNWNLLLAADPVSKHACLLNIVTLMCVL